MTNNFTLMLNYMLLPIILAPRKQSFFGFPIIMLVVASTIGLAVIEAVEEVSEL